VEAKLPRAKQPDLVIDSIVKSLEDVLAQLKALQGERPPKENKPPAGTVSHIKAGISIFSEAYTLRFGSPPYLTAADKFQLGKLHSELPDFKEIVDDYLMLNDKFIIDNGHAARFIASRVDALRRGKSGVSTEQRRDWT
jgi:hypothetical protein